MLRRSRFLRGSTNRYTDGSGRRLDSSNIPSDLDLQPISNRAYPVRGEHWQPVLVGEPSPHKGNVIVSGAGTVGMATAAIFALRGWHATVVERQPSVLRMQSATSEGGEILSSYYGSLSAGLQHALITRRAADALQAAGLRVSAFRHCGVPVTGVLDHPGAYNSWFTRGLVEHHPFAVKMLSVNLLALRQVLEKHLHNLPTGNCRVFHQHVVEAVNPLKQQLVVKPISDSSKPLEGARSAVHNGDDNPFSSNEVDKHGMQQGTHMETSLTLHRVKWEKKYANDAVDYDLLVCAEGVNSRLRDLVDVEGFAADVDFGVRWLVLRSRHLSSEHIHRWLHRRKGPAPLHEVCSPHQVPLAIAFPRIPQNKEAPPTARAGDSEADVEATKSFALMLYAPMDDLQRLSDHEALRTFCPDIVQADGSCNATSYAKNVVPFPTIHCENLYNAVGLPSAVVVGDAAHTCNPFWLQGLAMGLEDGVNLLNQVDAYSKHFYDAIKQYSQERGCSGDALRLITDRCLYYERTKHINPLVRFQDSYRRAMNIILPKIMNEYYTGASVNQLYSKSLESMLNGRGYASYEFAEKQQSKHSAFHHIGRVYT
ncbi:flavoprotein monooxygenase, putative [Trypanosoma brucei gambiense DAL972]|uniref:Flavoprotein monooxygenase, putative n=1 Tax=Trypanosoma brucei gambiense (strain MHOM/CI/86/DAL972) TaxID=679716 RepID=C9ZXY4_TRYB9|nr:flavoprotein monooxygenase, putative [Trypanosoma brucei gambiense DAL972]CBH14279.1 flavoprotein monooxygenase, putative [Trypanosoma brucei gambiense DAL972]|eukprot:XP_011776549.1 flavoprotein monooxygenase, putative [Trypanosoma brucei gambiense DAL972]